LSGLDKARETQLKNIQTKTGKNLTEIQALIAQSGLQKHADIRQMLMERLGLGYGDANSLVHYAMATDGQSAAEASGLGIEDVLAEIYSGAKASLRPVHEAVMTAIASFGSFEVVPKKGYVSLRRKKQFAMLGPGSKGRLEVGLNSKGIEASSRLEAQPPGGMCQYKVFLTSTAEVDADLIGWIRQAFESAG
jgi:hypothetical protein